VHGDLFRDNVLWKDGRVRALLDFESASHESYPFDLMVTLLAWCFGDRLEPALARAMAQGYARVRPLPEAEAARLHDEGSFAALRFSVTRITDFELRPRGLGVFKDFRRFVARAEALDALGPAGLRAMLGI
jgi:homoserine kinase type II